MRLFPLSPQMHWQSSFCFYLIYFMCICVHHLCVWYKQRTKGGHWVPWKLRDRCLKALMWLLVIDHGSSGRPASVLKGWTLSSPRKLLHISILHSNSGVSYVWLWHPAFVVYDCTSYYSVVLRCFQVESRLARF